MSEEMDYAQLVAQEDEIKILMAKCAELEAKLETYEAIISGNNTMLEMAEHREAKLRAERDEAVSAVQRLSAGQPFDAVVVADTVKRRTAWLEAKSKRMKARLIELAAQMALRKGMPDPDSWPGWGSRVPRKLWRAARDECDRARDQCADWAYELRKIIDAS